MPPPVADTATARWLPASLALPSRSPRLLALFLSPTLLEVLHDMIRDLGIAVAGRFPPARLSPIFPRPPRPKRLAASRPAASIVTVDLLRICWSHVSSFAVKASPARATGAPPVERGRRKRRHLSTFLPKLVIWEAPGRPS